MTEQRALWVAEHNVPRDHAGNAVAPHHPAGLPWAYEVLNDGRRLYGIDGDSVIAELVPGHDPTDPEARTSARIRHASATAVELMAQLRTKLDVDAGDRPLTHREIEIMNSSPLQPAGVADWDAPVPLVLLNVVYAPYTAAAAPHGNVRWLYPSDADSYLRSLAELGVYTVNIARAL